MMRRHHPALSFVAAASLALGLIAAASGASHLAAPQVGAPVDSAHLFHLVAGPDAFRAVLGSEADHVASVARGEQAGSARLLLLLASSLCASGLFGRPRLRGRAPHSPARATRTRAHRGVGLRAPPSSVLA